ncbi:TspO/MBR family protein [Nocardioides sp. SYSU DS0651]|uniref:TspO/MBR family protein n=1 Tax=Nocardioides sp. SYSU DS0651 TaxID=3415955 RepID=UPI003F4C61F0
MDGGTTTWTDGASGNRQPWVVLAGFLAAVAVAAVVGTLAAADSRETYQRLDLPAFAPPGWLFGPVWTVLYVLVAVAGWLAWRRAGVDAAFTAWCVQLVLNAAWTPLFFAAERYWLAFAELCFLWAAIVVTTVLFRRRSTAATLLMLPYLAWVTYAGALNLAIALAN